MNQLEELKEVLTEGCIVRLVEDDIYSVLPNVSDKYLYDRRAAVYDSVVSTWLYNRVMWGTSPLDYVAFAREAMVAAHPTGRMLDAGCGSLLFTAEVYLASDRQVIAFDQSLEMLKRARARLKELAGSVPKRILLLQADLSNLLFRPGFITILCMNVLHQFGAASELIPQLGGLLANGGQLYLTSLVTNGRYVGDHWLRILYKTREFVCPRSGGELKELLVDSLGPEVAYRMKGNMAFATLTTHSNQSSLPSIQ